MNRFWRRRDGWRDVLGLWSDGTLEGRGGRVGITWGFVSLITEAISELPQAS